MEVLVLVDMIFLNMQKKDAKDSDIFWSDILTNEK